MMFYTSPVKFAYYNLKYYLSTSTSCLKDYLSDVSIATPGFIFASFCFQLFYILLFNVSCIVMDMSMP